MGVKTIPLSVDLWTAYLDAATEYYHTHDDYETKMRRSVVYYFSVVCTFVIMLFVVAFISVYANPFFNQYDSYVFQSL